MLHRDTQVPLDSFCCRGRLRLLIFCRPNRIIRQEGSRGATSSKEESPLEVGLCSSFDDRGCYVALSNGNPLGLYIPGDIIFSDNYSSLMNVLLFLFGREWCLVLEGFKSVEG